MKFNWNDDEEKWYEGEKVKETPFMDWVREYPKDFFGVAVIVLIICSLYSGKVILWVVKLFVE